MQNSWNRKLKAKEILVLVGAPILIFVAIASIGNSNHRPKSTQVNIPPIEQPKKQEQATAIKTDSQPAVEASANDAKSNQQNQSASPSKTLSEEDQIKQLVSKQLEGANDVKKNYTRKIEVVEQIDGGWGVFTEYNADDKGDIKLRKEGIQIKMSDIYKAIYTSGKDIRTASVTAYYPTVDKYGKASDSVVYKTMLEKGEADKVNWNADKYYLETEILPRVWETILINIEFR